jgi:hypothetical protein
VAVDRNCLCGVEEEVALGALMAEKLIKTGGMKKEVAFDNAFDRTKGSST